jgi:hypothetical protein
MSGGDDVRIETGSESEDGAGVLGALDLFLFKQSPGTQQDFRQAGGNAPDRLLGRGGAEGDFHDVEAAREQRFCQWLGGLDTVKDDDGDNAFGENAIDRGEAGLRGIQGMIKKMPSLWSDFRGGLGKPVAEVGVGELADDL